MAALAIPPSNEVMPGSYQLPHISFPEPVIGSTLPPNPERVATEWAASFTSRIQEGITDVSGLFLKESYWRDLLCLTWNFHTFHGPEKVTSFLADHSKEWRIRSVSIDTSSDFRRPAVAPIDFPGSIKCVQSFIVVETDVGKGRGLVRLLPDEHGSWKCYTLFTFLYELTGHEEMNYARRPTGADHVSRAGRINWKDNIAREENFKEIEPAVLIIGCGQGGLTVAARLKQLGVRTLVIDRIPSVGDNWRNRYHHLVLHDSVWFDHMPYLDFPPHWPIFTPKDRLANWFESYVKILELNVWTSTTIKRSEWNNATKTWTIELERELNGTTNSYIIHPHHVVLATGASGKPSMPLIPGTDTFQGDRLIHSSKFHGVPPNTSGKGKNAVVIGSSNSAHDIAQDYHEHGYSVTMIQRSSTHVVGCHTLMDVTMAGLYCEGGPPVDDADVISHSLPWPVLKRFQIDATNECIKRDHALLADLQSAGFSLDSGPDGAGLWTKYLSRGGGYYIDTGCSALITTGAIKVKATSIIRINAHSIACTDGEELPADEIIFATGYGNMRESAEEIFGEDVAKEAGEVWGFDAEGETRGLWRRSGKESFWYMGGNLALCRFYSRALALQIKGTEEKLLKWEDP